MEASLSNKDILSMTTERNGHYENTGYHLELRKYIQIICMGHLTLSKEASDYVFKSEIPRF